jgi:hypothetical protein
MLVRLSWTVTTSSSSGLSRPQIDLAPHTMADTQTYSSLPGDNNTELRTTDYEDEVYQRGLQFSRPPFTVKSLDWEGLAKQHMSAESTGYLVGNAGIGETATKNRSAFKRWSVVPLRLAETEKLLRLSTQLLGHRVPVPFAMAPVGAQRIFNPEGEVAAARAASDQYVPFNHKLC